MSEDLVAVASLAASDIEAAARRATDYLTSKHVIAGNAERDGLWQSSEWAAGDGLTTS